MKINVLSFYSDFTNAFSFINNYSRSKNLNINFSINYTTHLSGFLVGVFSSNFKNIFLPVAVRMNMVRSHEYAYDYTWVSEYLRKSGCKHERSIRIAKLYVDYFIVNLKKHRPDKIIISGDSRVQSRALKIAADFLEIDTFYFEQGPFGTTVLDQVGVNANASFVDSINMECSSNAPINLYHVRKKRKTYWRLVDYAFEYFFLLFGFSELKEEKSILSIIKRSSRDSIYKNKTENTLDVYDILVVGQVPQDANILLHIPYKNFSQIIQTLLAKNPDSKVLFREHPLYRGCYEEKLYSLEKTNDNFHISQCKNLDDDISKCKNILVVNSLTGLEVILKHRRSIWVLGDAIYGKLSACKVTDLERFQPIETELLTQTHHDEAYNWFCANYLTGHFRDANLDIFCEAVIGKINDS